MPKNGFVMRFFFYFWRGVGVVGAERSIQLSYNRTPILTAQGESVIIIIADSCGKCK